MLINKKRSIIPSCDVSDLEMLDNIVKLTHDIEGIGAYKVGLELVIPYGLKAVVDVIRTHTDLPIIYDHQKAGNDIPKMGKRFARVCKLSGVDAVILYPFAGPTTEKSWIEECKEIGLFVMVGGHMTHKDFIASEGGFVANYAPDEIYRTAIKCGIVDFVGPYNKLDIILWYTNMFKKYDLDFTWYTPGFTSDITYIKKYKEVVGENWHVIIGSEIYNTVLLRAKTKYLAGIVLNS